MLIDLWPYVEKDLDQVCLALTTKGWQREDENILSKEIRRKRYAITLVPRLLYYYFQNAHRAIPWIAVRIINYSDDHPIPTFVLQEILEDLYYSNLKPFYDEDAWKGFFSKEKTRFGEDIYICYINPDFPTGYWENHTI